MDHKKIQEERKKKGRRKERKKSKEERKENNPQLYPNCRLFNTVDNENESHKKHSWNFNS